MAKAFSKAATLVTLLSVIASVLLAGQAFFTCPSMQRTAKSSCCEEARPSTTAPAISRAPCCTKHLTATAPGAPTNTPSQASDVPTRSSLARELIPLLALTLRDDDAGTDAREPAARAGPPPPLFELHSTYLI